MLARTVVGGTEIGVRVAPGSRWTRIVGRYGDRLKVQVSAVAEGGRANLAVRRLLADTFGIALADVEIVRGETSPDKIIRLRGVAAEVVERLK